MEEKWDEVLGSKENPFINFARTLLNVLDAPATYWKEKVIKPHQQHYPWYHEKFRRVPTIDECYTDDDVCVAEADLQMYRDKLVEEQIVKILRGRFEECSLNYGKDTEMCKHIYNTYDDAATAFFIKYGDLGIQSSQSRKVFMKQKHRMVWERRHGEVGTGTRFPEKNL